LRKASRRVSQLYDQALGPSGLRSTQYSILAEIERRGGTPPTMRELADAMVMDRSTLGHNLRPLERDALVAIEAGEGDRRRKHVRLTPAGLERLTTAQSLWVTAQTRFEHVLGAEAAQDLRTILLGIAADRRLAHAGPSPAPTVAD
jgi:DNA-binding MarR family transcriptional regulator